MGTYRATINKPTDAIRLSHVHIYDSLLHLLLQINTLRTLGLLIPSYPKRNLANNVPITVVFTVDTSRYLQNYVIGYQTQIIIIKIKMSQTTNTT